MLSPKKQICCFWFEEVVATCSIYPNEFSSNDLLNFEYQLENFICDVQWRKILGHKESEWAFYETCWIEEPFNTCDGVSPFEISADSSNGDNICWKIFFAMKII